MSIESELLERIKSESKEETETFGELSPELQKRFDVLRPSIASEEEVVDIRRRLMNSFTGDELLDYFSKRFQEITVPEKYLAVKKKLIGILLEDL